MYRLLLDMIIALALIVAILVVWTALGGYYAAAQVPDWAMGCKVRTATGLV